MSNAYSSFVSSLSDAQTAALVEVMYLAASADGEFTDDEREEFTNGIESMTEQKIPAARIGKLISEAQAALDSSDRTARLEAIKDVITQPGMRKLALGMAIRVTAADGIIRTSERELILEAAEILEIDGNTAADLVRDLGRL